jgi:hypothetical protein
MEGRRSSENKRNWKSKSGRWASSIFFVPGTLVRTWGTRRLPSGLIRPSILPDGTPRTAATSCQVLKLSIASETIRR